MITLIDFHAEWCGPCQAMDPIIKKIMPDYDNKVTLKDVDVDSNQLEAQNYGVMSIPTFVIEKDGKEIDRRIGAMTEQDLRNWLDSNA